MTEQSRTDDVADFVIVGSGAGAVAAALKAKACGLKPLILEKTEALGGSTAISGGVLWIPNSPPQQRAGVQDTEPAAAAYLAACAGMGVPTRGASAARQRAFLETGPEVVRFLEAKGMKFKHAEGYSDYHEGELPGGCARSRSLVIPPYNARRLGEKRHLLRRNKASKTGVPAMANELPMLSLNGLTWRSKLVMIKVGLLMMCNRLGADIVGFGGALQGRLLEIAWNEGIDIRVNAPVTGLIIEDGRVRGVEITGPNGVQRIEARRGVLLNTGGFAHNQAMRDKYLPKPTSAEWTHANPGETGEMIIAAEGAGAALEAMDLAWWLPGSLLPDGTRLVNSSDVTKPFMIIVDAAGNRVVSESTSYVKIGLELYERNKTVPSVPAWAISDDRNRRRYRWGGIFPPGPPPKQWLDCGFIIAANSLKELAEKCGIDAAGLESTVSRFNGFARTGVDEDFGRGGSAYNRFQGDPTVKPNPNLGAIEKSPFYAIRIYPTDVGTSGGIVTDEFGRALDETGGVIEGLYATGNCTSSVVGRSYPGAGASIGASMVFAYIAAAHAAGHTCP